MARGSVRVPDGLARAVRKKVGARELSEREQLELFLAELDDALGPVPAKTLEQARAAWPKR